MDYIVGDDMAHNITSDADEEWFRSPAMDRPKSFPNIARACQLAEKAKESRLLLLNASLQVPTLVAASLPSPQ